jgi:hypothetical protein
MVDELTYEQKVEIYYQFGIDPETKEFGLPLLLQNNKDNEKVKSIIKEQVIKQGGVRANWLNAAI